jgi:hypothetical protein
MNQSQGITWAVLVPVLVTLLGVLIAQAVTLYNSRVSRLASARDSELKHQADLSKDLRSDRVVQYAKCLTAARNLYTFLEGVPPRQGQSPSSTAELEVQLGPDFRALLNTFNESMNGAQLLSGPDVSAELQATQSFLVSCAASRTARPDVINLPSFAGNEARLIGSMRKEVVPERYATPN